MDFLKSGCESWAEVQAENFCFECKGCAKTKGLAVEIERLRQLVLALVEREQVKCANGSFPVGGGAEDDKVWGGDKRDARESSPQIGRRLKGGEVARWKETGAKDTGRKEKGEGDGSE